MLTGIVATVVAVRMQAYTLVYIWVVVVVTWVTLHSNEVFAPRCEAPRQGL